MSTEVLSRVLDIRYVLTFYLWNGNFTVNFLDSSSILSSLEGPSASSMLSTTTRMILLIEWVNVYDALWAKVCKTVQDAACSLCRLSLQSVATDIMMPLEVSDNT